MKRNINSPISSWFFLPVAREKLLDPLLRNTLESCFAKYSEQATRKGGWKRGASRNAAPGCILSACPKNFVHVYFPSIKGSLALTRVVVTIVADYTGL